MIRVRVELLSAITGQTTELARMDIANDGVASSENHRLGDYSCQTYKGRSAEALDKGQIHRSGKIADWRRLDFHVWNLVALALLRMGYTQGHSKSPAMASHDAVDRDVRQRRVADWCAAAFGAEHQSSVPQRGLRMLEEAIETYQALGGDPPQAHKLVDYIFIKKPGELFQELGGLGITVLALAAAAGISADDAEQAELTRVLSKPLAWFHARNQAKSDAGFDALAYPNRREGM